MNEPETVAIPGRARRDVPSAWFRMSDEELIRYVVNIDRTIASPEVTRAEYVRALGAR